MTATDASEKKSPAIRSARRRAREFALQGLYQWLVGGADAAAVEDELQEREMRRGETNESANESATESTRHPARATTQATAAERAAALARRADMAHFRQVLHGAIDHAAELRADFVPFIDRDIKQLSPVEHAILLIGSYELKHCAEIPYRVVINEAVELAKSFGGAEGFKYVNGVLDRVAQQLRATETERTAR